MRSSTAGSVIQWLRRDPGRAMILFALVAVAIVYAPTLSRGIVNYDDTWLIRDNQVLQHASWSSLHTIFFDLDSPQRFSLTPEYLPVRDLSVMLDFAIWGHAYGGFHLTNMVIYMVAIVVWFDALQAFGLDRTLVGLALLIWALHPSHAESVAWLSERKGLLAMLCSGGCVLAYARFRTGRSGWWLVLAMTCAVAAVWSKAPALFAIASLAGLELVLAGRRSWRRSLAGLVAIGTVTALAFIPVITLAYRWSVIGSAAAQPASRGLMVLGVHGFYLRLGAMAMPNAVTYPLSTNGPGGLDVVVGAIGLAAVVAVLALAIVPRRGRWTPSQGLRAASVIWLFGWLPVSHLIVPLQMVFVADRYLLIPSLGLALAIAVGILRVTSRRARVALATVIVLAASVRALDAQASWRDGEALWQRAVSSNPDDGNAWSMYLEALEETGQTELADLAVARGLEHTSSPRLVMHDALLSLRSGDHARGVARMTEAAGGGEPRAMANLAVLLLNDGRAADALVWARLATLTAPQYVNSHRIRGKVALATNRLEEARAAFARAYELEPDSTSNRLNLALALIALHRATEARPLLEACLDDPQLGPRARELLATLPR